MLTMLCSMFFVSALGQAPSSPAQRQNPLRVVLMVGQSNMVGHGYFDARNATTHRPLNGTLSWLVTDPRTKEEFSKLRGADGWVQRDDVFIINDVNGDCPNASSCYEAKTSAASPTLRRVRNVGAKLGVGWGGESTSIGPELGVGWAVGDALVNQQVLLLKVAWGGKTLGVDFRPPSSGGQVGPYYVGMVKKVRESLSNLKTLLPSYSGSFEVIGFIWHQGWNDGCNLALAKEYGVNLPNLIRDLRKEFSDLPGVSAHGLPVSIGASGMSGTDNPENAFNKYIIPAQLSVANATLFPEFVGNVASFDTRPFFRPEMYSPGSQVYHWFNNCESYWRLGQAMGTQLIKLLGPLPPPPAPLPPTPAPAPPLPSANAVLLYEQGGAGKLLLHPANFSRSNQTWGQVLAWDACGGLLFDNGHPVWAAAGCMVGEVQVLGAWSVRLGQACCFHYHYPGDCGLTDHYVTAGDGVVNDGKAYVEIKMN